MLEQVQIPSCDSHEHDNRRLSRVRLMVKTVLITLLNAYLDSIYLYFPPSSQLVYLCFYRPMFLYVAITLATGLVGVEVTSVSWLGQLTVGV